MSNSTRFPSSLPLPFSRATRAGGFPTRSTVQAAHRF